MDINKNKLPNSDFLDPNEKPDPKEKGEWKRYSPSMFATVIDENTDDRIFIQNLSDEHATLICRANKYFLYQNGEELTLEDGFKFEMNVYGDKEAEKVLSILKDDTIEDHPLQKFYNTVWNAD